MQELINAGLTGANLTAPCKELFLPHLKQSSGDDEILAVNTLTVMSDGSIQGFNTDGIGLVRDLQRQGINIKGKNLLILGAGGAVKGILSDLINLQPRKITIINRNLFKAEQVIHAQKSKRANNCEMVAKTYEEIECASFDIIVNATSAGIFNKLPPLTAKFNFKNSICYDLNYAKKASCFLDYALERGAIHVSDGLGMLIEQALESFYIWHNIRVNSNEIFELLKDKNFKIL
jgi:shikimate dehydrogenase